MKLADVHRSLLGMAQPVFTTNDAKALLEKSKDHASHLLRRLVESGHLVKLKRGLWAFPKDLNAFIIPEYLTAPFPSYVSLQSALYYHGLISQIPEVTYSISPARTRAYRTPLGTFSIHHVKPSFFIGYEMTDGGAKIATQEKALLDFLYLTPAKTNLFRALPELELPSTFQLTALRKMIRSIEWRRRRTLAEERLQALLRQK